VPVWMMVNLIFDFAILCYIIVYSFSVAEQTNWYNERLVKDIKAVRREYIVLLVIFTILGLTSVILFAEGKKDSELVRIAIFLVPIKYFVTNMFFLKIADMGLE
jgi:ABC-type transport system involved in cytochrome c biogenesis permease subunit